MAQALGSQVAKNGQHIFIYNNIRTNQVVYSLTRSLNNHDAIKQLPFLGKKTVPASLRKDLWLPLALVEFPKPMQGLVAYRKLREFRRLHETTYPYELITRTEGQHKGQLMGTKERGKVLMNQKANTVADLAAVLLQQERGPTAEQAAAAEKRMHKAQKLKRQPAGKRKAKMNPVPMSEMVGVDGVRIRWANPLDAEFAETWPAAVVHDDLLQRSRYTAAFPQIETETETDILPRESGTEAGAAPFADKGSGQSPTAATEAAALVSASTIPPPAAASPLRG